GTYPNPTIKRSATDDTSRAIGADHIKSAAVTTTKVADGAITTAKLDNAAVTRAKLSIDGCASGEVLKSNGTGWVCGADSGFISSIVNIVSDYVVTANDNGKIFVATSPIFITLPDSSTVPSGFQVAVKLAFGGGSLNVKPTGSDPIDGLNLGVLF